MYERILAREENEEKKLALKLLLVRIAAVVGDEKSLLRFLNGLPVSANKEKDVLLHR